MALNNTYDRSGQRPRTSPTETPYLGTNILQGVPIQCQFCSGQAFRRSSLRSEDFTQILLMRYPVRCLRCSQRQMVSFTIAGISMSSKIRPQRSMGKQSSQANWADPAKTHAESSSSETSLSEHP